MGDVRLTLRELRFLNNKLYGFYPMASSVKFNPSKADVPSFTVTRDDPELAPVYNTYLNTAGERAGVYNHFFIF